MLVNQQHQNGNNEIISNSMIQVNFIIKPVMCFYCKIFKYFFKFTDWNFQFVCEKLSIEWSISTWNSN